VTIEIARVADAEALAALAGQLGYPSSAAQITGRLAEFDADHRVWVARSEDAVLGWIHAYVARYLVLEPFVEIGGLIVADGARGQGVGPRLIEEACTWARALGCDRVGVHSNVVREDAHRFYEREGFTLEKRQGVFTRRLS
jgi:GNAT superfamily N-acetyltransferase